MYSVGNKIHHDAFGYGICEEINNKTLTIRFEDGTIREIGKEYPRMKVVEPGEEPDLMKDQRQFNGFLSDEREAGSTSHSHHWRAITPHENLYNYLLTKIGPDSYLLSDKDRVIRPLYKVPDLNMNTRLYRNQNLMYYAQRNGPDGQLKVKSWYPFFTGKTGSELKINKIIPWHGGGEAQLLCTLEDQVEIAFHDTHFHINRAAYGPEYIYTFFLTGLAYQCRVALEQEIELDPATDKIFQDFAGGEPDFNIPKKISMKGMSLFLNHPDGDVDDYTFRGTVKKVTHTRFFDLPFYCFRASILRIPLGTGDKDIDFDIFVSPHSLEGKVPRVGDDIEGVLLFSAMQHPNNFSG